MNAQQAIAFSIKPLTFAIVMLGIHGCATQPSASQPLSQRVLQANQNLLSRQSYAYDYRVNVVRPPLRSAQALAASPNRLKLIHQLSAAQHLDARQQALVTEGVNHQTREQSEAGQVMDILTKRFEFASTGVVDFRRGQMSIVPEFRYVQNNAGAFIKVPLAAPQNAKVVNSPRIFMDARTGAIAGLSSAATHGKGQPSPTDQCHDITVYSELGLAAGACSGNGILLDIKDPVNPKRIDAVNDPNYAYWHSAAFSNDGKKVVFTDEWGGGMGARCRENDPNVWGANAIFKLADNKLTFENYYKMPSAQGDSENCVAHNGSLVPVPGRDIKVQAWYQGGISIMDFTDAAHPMEIGYFDRGAIDPNMLILAGSWSAYWYNGRIYSSEIARGLDIFELTPTKFLTQNEIDAAKAVQVAELNVQNQQKIVWPNKLVVAKAYIDQLERSQTLSAGQINELRLAIQKAESSRLKKNDVKTLNGLADSVSKVSAKTDGSL